jgi:transglutaminase-like putative cysteine protease
MNRYRVFIVMQKRLIAVWLACLFCGTLCLAPNSAICGSAEDWAKMKLITPRGYVCGFAAQPPKIDGKLDDPAWQAAPWTEDFQDIEGPTKPKPRFRTRAKMLWDNDNFYIAAELQEPHVMGTITKHDAVIFEDNDFEVFINPDGDNHNYYELELNALNTTWDLFLNRPYKDGGTADNSFEFNGMKTAVHVNGTLNNPDDKDIGWSVEIAIPWKALAQRSHRQCPPRSGDQWRIDFSRVEWKFDVVDGKYVKGPKLPENNWIWSPPGIVDMHRPERWGYVQFSKDPPGKGAFVADPTLPARDRLMEVYHHEKSFHEEHGHWASSLKELGLEQAASKEFPKPLELKTTAGGFEATLEVRFAGGPARRLQVRQDSHLTSAADDPLQTALDRAGKNRAEIEKALKEVPAEHREAMEFLVVNMPRGDLRELSAEFLLENVRLAYKAWDEAPWKNEVPKEIFLNYVLPYANIDERRDPWRKEFYEKYRPLIKDARTPGEAATLLNQKVFPDIKVHYSTKRPKAVQSPAESARAGLASCTGLTIILVDACRAAGVPARFVGTVWVDNSGNHSWTEVWNDGGWHYTGSAEPAGDKLDKAWFGGKAAAAPNNDPWHAIYAVSFKHTPVKFPLAWDPAMEVYSLNVTDRYKNEGPKTPAGTIPVPIRVLVKRGGDRCGASLTILDAAGKTVFKGTTKDERFDANDHLLVYLPPDKEYRAEIEHAGHKITETFRAERRDTLLTWYMNAE